MRIKVFGEILWDVFGDDSHIGGAPFNFAAHMARLGAETMLISAVGKDKLGYDALEIASEYGINTEEISLVDLPTGYCNVTLDGGIPSYELVTNVAYDAIPKPKDGKKADALYFGTLACRDVRSRKTLEDMLRGDYDEVFFDINIRQRFYTEELIDFLIKHATILKISREEIGVLGIDGSCEEIASEVAKKYQNLKLIIVTLDHDGAFALDCKTNEMVYVPARATIVKSTVGAGDSFSACFLFHWLRGSGLNKAMQCATTLGGFVVTRLEAVPEYPDKLKMEIMDK